jgi:uncharacterized protein YyaL (SSP411 family)
MAEDALIPAGGLRQRYWEARKLAAELKALLVPPRRALLAHVLKDEARYLAGALRPVHGDVERRARAAAHWLLHAQQASADDGVPLGYFPCRSEGAPWMPSYPETTGYIVTTLLAYAEAFEARFARDAALRMASWEIAVQMPSGAVQGGPIGASPPTAAAFNTGMVLDGWCSAFAATRDSAFLGAAARAAEFLIGDLDDAGYFRTNGEYVSGGEIKTYTCLCAWPLYRYAQIAQEPRYRDAAVRIVDAALLQQQRNGWFRHNCLTRSSAPLTHTIGYTLQGILEVGLLAGREDYVDAVLRAAMPLCALCERRALLPARLDAEWRPASSSSCLTGNAQIAVVCLRLHEHIGERRFRQAGERLVDALKALQTLDSALPDVNGAIPGSFPLFGEYMRGGYPSWATKYFLDALLLQRRLTAPASR